LRHDQNISQFLSFSAKTDDKIGGHELDSLAKSVEEETNSMHEADDNSSNFSYTDRAAKASQEDSSTNKDELYWTKGKWRDYLQ
jgi:hypothetical protein